MVTATILKSWQENPDKRSMSGMQSVHLSQGEKSLGIKVSPKTDKIWTTDGQILIKIWILENFHCCILD